MKCKKGERIMIDPDRIEISYYENMFDQQSDKVCSLGWFLTGCGQEQKIAEIRGIEDKKTRDRMKRQLPQATISGIFSPSRKAEHLQRHSGLICVDIDYCDNSSIENFNTLKKDVFSHIDNVAYAGLSVSGRGYFLIVPLAYPEKHRLQFLQLRQDFYAQGLVIDSACSDVCRLRCASCDSDPYINWEAVPYRGWYRTEKPHYGVRKDLRAIGDISDALQRVVDCCEEIERRHINMADSYDDWYHIGFALASMGESGRACFHAVSRQSPKYSLMETDRKFTALLQRHNHRIGIGTFFKYCQEHGVM